MKALIALLALATLTGCVSTPSKPYTTQAQDHWKTSKAMYDSLGSDIEACANKRIEMYSPCFKKTIAALLIRMDSNPNIFADEYEQIAEIMANVNTRDPQSVQTSKNQVNAVLISMKPEMNKITRNYTKRAEAAHTKEYARTMEELKVRQVQAAQIAREKQRRQQAALMAQAALQPQTQTVYVQQPIYGQSASSAAVSNMVMSNMPRPGFNPSANSRSKTSSFILQRNSGNRLVHCTTGYCF